MKIFISSQVHLFDFRAVASDIECDTIGCGRHGVIEVAILGLDKDAIGRPRRLVFYLCEKCAFNNPITGLLLEKLEE